MSVYEALRRAGIPTDHHESDLYVLDTPQARALLRKHGESFSSFVSQIDGRRWLDVPFAYEPFWRKKAVRSSAKRDPARSPKKKLQTFVVSYEGIDGTREYIVRSESLAEAQSAAYLRHGHGRAKVRKKRGLLRDARSPRSRDPKKGGRFVRHDDGSVDRRFTFTREHTGHASGRPRWVARFADRRVGEAATREAAVRLAQAWNRARWSR